MPCRRQEPNLRDVPDEIAPERLEHVQGREIEEIGYVHISKDQVDDPLEGVFGDEVPERQKQVLGHRVGEVETRLHVWVLRELCSVPDQSRGRVRRHVTRHFLPCAQVHIFVCQTRAGDVHRHERDVEALEIVLDDVEIMKDYHPDVDCTSGLGICISLCMSSHAVLVFHHNNALAQVA